MKDGPREVVPKDDVRHQGRREADQSRGVWLRSQDRRKAYRNCRDERWDDRQWSAA